jgi:hypothetical protein
MAPELDENQDKGPWSDSRVIKCAQAIFATVLCPGIIIELHQSESRTDKLDTCSNYFCVCVYVYPNGFSGTRYRSWLSYATSWEVAGSIPDEVIAFFNWPNPSSRTVALGSTQLLTEMNTRNLPGGNGRSARRADKFTTICEPIV